MAAESEERFTAYVEALWTLTATMPATAVAGINATYKGRSRAKARGQHMERPPKLTDVQKAEARQRRAEGATPKNLALSYNVARATISWLGI